MEVRSERIVALASRAGLAFALAVLGSACNRAPEEPLASWRDAATGMEFLFVPAGSYVIGSPAGEPGHEPQETLHRVTLRRGVWLGRFEVTQGEWSAVMGANPSRFAEIGPRAPVERVSELEVEAFLAELGRRSPGSRFRLPTEAEWEVACRAGRSTPYSTGERLTTEQANYDGRYPLPGQPPGAYLARTTPVGTFPPNPWGFYDLHGNVWEWTADDFCPYAGLPESDPIGRCDSGLRVIRGGSWYFNADSARCAVRYTHARQLFGPSLGFRVAREPAGGATD